MTRERPLDFSARLTLNFMLVVALLLVIGTFLTAVDRLFGRDSSGEAGQHFSAGNQSLKRSNDGGCTYPKTASVQPSVLKRFFKCFCIITNGSRILTVQTQNEFGCVHGIRFLSTAWIILGHTYSDAARLLLFGNPKDVLHEFNHPINQIVNNGHFAVDSFLVISGFLLSYLFLREVENVDCKVNWLKFYAYRFWRLTPVYAVVLAFYSNLVAHLANGPLWPNVDFAAKCKLNWWRHMLYINNFLKYDDLCMKWSWYLALDMQFYIISPIFLYLLWKKPKAGISFCFQIMICSCIITAIISYNNDAALAFMLFNDTIEQKQPRSSKHFWEKIYVMPYTRIGSYLIGIILGYVIYNEERRKRHIPKLMELLIWTVATLSFLLVFLSLNYDHETKWVIVLYHSLSGPVFAGIVSWIIYACVTRRAGAVSAVLSWSFFVPLSRLSYCAFLIHPIITGSFYASLKSAVQPTLVLAITIYSGFVVLSYLSALLFSLAFESPCLAIQKTFFSKGLKPRQRVSSDTHKEKNN